MKKSLILGVLALGSLTLYNCDVDKKGKLEMPEVAVDVEEGNIPNFDVDWAEVNVGTKTKMVKVPTVKVVVEEMEVEVPYVDVDMPNEDKEELSVAVEAEVNDFEHEINIKEIRASKNRLFVVSQLDKLDVDLDGNVLRVQDQIELNAPDLDIKHYIIGKKPNRSFNSRYTYVSNMNNLPTKVKEAKVIYKK